MFIVKDTAKVDITIDSDDNQLQMTLGNLKHCIIVDNIQYLVPMIDMRFIDATGVTIKDVTIGDGTVMQVGIGKDTDSGTFLKKLYRISSVKEHSQVPAGLMYRVIGVLDEYKYMRGQVQKSYGNMTSSDAIQQAATDAGITNIVLPDTTPNDKMNWLPAGKSYGNFCHHVANHGWIDDKSCMVLGVSSDTQETQLSYLDMTIQAQKSPTATFANNPSDGEIRVHHFEMKNLGGMMNSFVNYGHVATEESIYGSNTYTQTAATKTSTFININESVKGDVGNTRRTFLPLNCGNVSEKYTVAKYQNDKLLASYSYILVVIVSTFTSVKLFDVVKVRIADINNNDSRQDVSGIYVVAAKIKIIANNTYYEKFRLVSTGPNQNVSNEFF